MESFPFFLTNSLILALLFFLTPYFLHLHDIPLALLWSALGLILQLHYDPLKEIWLSLCLSWTLKMFEVEWGVTQFPHPSLFVSL